MNNFLMTKLANKVLSLLSSDGRADERYGVCSNYLERLEKDEEIQIFVRSAPNFHLPKDTSQPIILIGPGKSFPL